MNLDDTSLLTSKNIDILNAKEKLEYETRKKTVSKAATMESTEGQS